ncbi:MAG: hypothetical protein IKT98_00970 [Selenomonadaceae bacterium]|nr:hypothetical protein [Selenomonadaceae bacterium]
MIKKNNSVEELTRKEFAEFISKLEVDFPSAEKMAQAAREIHEIIFDHSEDIVKNPDKKLLQWIDLEYELFQSIERARYGEQIHKGFETMQSFIDLANFILNRRKSRTGKSLEWHLSAIFDGNYLPYESQVVTEANKKPDFIFPSGKAYHDLNYDADKLIVLASKTTCKDRWRQIINEADRVRNKNKYLFTLQQGISVQQLTEMKIERVVLIVPEPHRNSFPEEFRNEILNLKQFISLVKETVTI